MHIDAYTRLILTIIAASLLAIVCRGMGAASLRAAANTRCAGEVKATSANPMQASIGASYRIDVTCE
jgi:hypothetical protein